VCNVDVVLLHYFVELNGQCKTVQAYADEIGIPFLETSAKESINVEGAFLAMSAAIKKRLRNEISLKIRYFFEIFMLMKLVCLICSKAGSQGALERKASNLVQMKGQPIQQLQQKQKSSCCST
jgi:Ras-related protein Rab-1A